MRAIKKRKSDQRSLGYRLDEPDQQLAQKKGEQQNADKMLKRKTVSQTRRFV